MKRCLDHARAAIERAEARLAELSALNSALDAKRVELTRWEALKYVHDDSYSKTLKDKLSSVSGVRRISELFGAVDVADEFEIGFASLSLFLQANYTGPEIRSDLPFVYQGPNDSEIDASAEIEAATGSRPKDVYQDPWPGLTKQALDFLTLHSGARVHELCREVWALALAVHCVSSSSSKDAPFLWLKRRVLTTHFRSLKSRNASSDGGNELWFDPELSPHTRELVALDLLERGMQAHWFEKPKHAKKCIEDARAVLRLSVELTGRYGKRLKFQSFVRSQLVVEAFSDATSELVDDATRTTNHRVVRVSDLDPDTEVQENVTLVENPSDAEKGHVENDSTKLSLGHQSASPAASAVAAAPDLSTHGKLTSLEEAVLLGLCTDIKNSYAMEKLTAHEMLAYVSRITVDSSNWSVYSSALLLKSKLEHEHVAKKLERSVLQMQVLVDQQLDVLTPLQTRRADLEDPRLFAPAHERLKNLFVLDWPSTWKLRRTLADYYFKMGVVASALALYTDLRLWNDVVQCLVVLNKRNRAENLIQALLIASGENARGEKAELMCCLGEVTNDVDAFTKAIDYDPKYARAYRLRAKVRFDQKDFGAAANDLREAVALSPLNPWSWFRLGSCCLRMDDFVGAKKAFAEVVAQAPDDADAWANLGASHASMREYPQALVAFNQATKLSRQNLRMWQNLVTVAMRCGKVGLLVEGMYELVKWSHAESSTSFVDLEPLFFAIDSCDEELKPKLSRLIGLIESTSGMSNYHVFTALAYYYETVEHDPLKTKLNLSRRINSFISSTPDWFRKGAQIATLVQLCEGYVDFNRDDDAANSLRFVTTILARIRDDDRTPLVKALLSAQTADEFLKTAAAASTASSAVES